MWKQEVCGGEQRPSTSGVSLAHSCNIFPCYLGMEINAETQTQ